MTFRDHAQLGLARNPARLKAFWLRMIVSASALGSNVEACYLLEH